MAELKQEKFQKPNEESFGKREEAKITAQHIPQKNQYQKNFPGFLSSNAE